VGEIGVDQSPSGGLAPVGAAGVAPERWWVAVERVSAVGVEIEEAPAVRVGVAGVAAARDEGDVAEWDDEGLIHLGGGEDWG